MLCVMSADTGLYVDAETRPRPPTLRTSAEDYDETVGRQSYERSRRPNGRG